MSIKIDYQGEPTIKAKELKENEMALVVDKSFEKYKNMVVIMGRTFLVSLSIPGIRWDKDTPLEVKKLPKGTKVIFTQE